MRKTGWEDHVRSQVGRVFTPAALESFDGKDGVNTLPDLILPMP